MHFEVNFETPSISMCNNHFNAFLGPIHCKLKI